MPKKITYNPADRFAAVATIRTSNRIKNVYAEAEKDITKKLNTFMARFEKLDAHYRADVEAGKIKQADYDAWRRGQMFRGERWKAAKEDITKQIYKANQTAAGIINGERRAVFQQNANYTAYQIEKDTRGAVNFGLYDSATVTRLLKEDKKLLPEYKVNQEKDYKWNNRKVNNAVTQSIIQGESIDDLSKRLTHSLEAGNRSSMLNFARTAMTGAQNAGRVEAMHDAEDMGISVKKRWIATLDDRTRDTHRELDGQVVDVDEPFEVDGEEIMYPGDPNADPALVYNCRCTIGYEYPEYAGNGQRRDNETGEVIEYQTYSEWEAAKETETALKDSELSSIIGMSSSKDIKPAGRIDRSMFAQISKDITTDEVIITGKQITHSNKHKNAFERYKGYIGKVLNDPDLIFDDEKHSNTAIMLRKIDTVRGETLQLVLRLHTSNDMSGYKNSIISFWDINDSRRRNYERNKKIVYRRP